MSARAASLQIFVGLLPVDEGWLADDSL
jgi:hypothetical protein